jgi:hypothetical protein
MRLVLAAVLALLAAAPASAASRFNWDALGAEFCRLTLAGDLAGMAPILSRQLAADITFAASRTALPPAAELFQAYPNRMPVCEASTRSAAIVEIRHALPGGEGWSDFLVIVPETDGTTRIDDVLFATRKSDTLRARLAKWAGTEP